jgi:hypothetical protein
MSKAQEMQKIIRLYRDETGHTELDMHEVALFAMRKGWPMPIPKNPLDMLAAQFRDAARQEVRKDSSSGRPYRAYHAVPTSAAQGSFFWIDIDDPETTHTNMRKSAVMRREQMVDDGVQLSLDLDHWNSIRAEGERIELPMDISPDIEWRKASMDGDDDEAAAS